MKIGFIGSGNMGEAMIGGLVGKVVEPGDIIVSDLDESKLAKIKEKYGVNYTTDNNEVAKQSDIIILAVKPQFYDTVAEGIKNSYNPNTIVVTIAAGKTIAGMESIFGLDSKIVRTMPNTPAMVGEGMTCFCPNKNVTPDELNSVKSIFECLGKASQLPEKLFDAFTGISGSSPAYVFILIEAMADAAVIAGMPRDLAYQFSAQAVLGAAKMVLETGKHPGELKDIVCSPGGSTIEAVANLEQFGFRSAIINAVSACIVKSGQLG